MKEACEVQQSKQRRQQTQLAQLDAEYAGQWFEVVREVRLTGNQFWRNKFGRPGQHGWIIRNVQTGDQQVVGLKQLRLIHERYDAIELPWIIRPKRRFTMQLAREAREAAKLDAQIAAAVARAKADTAGQ